MLKLSAVAVLLSLAFAPAYAQDVELQASPPDSAERVSVLVELSDPPAALVYANTLRENAGLPPAQARALAAAIGRRQVEVVKDAQARFDAALARLAPTKRAGGRHEIYRVSKAFNGIALQVDPEEIEALRRLPGVKAVHPLVLEYPTNSSSVPFLGTPQLWADTLGLGLNADGTGVTIGIIDTGIDYQHASFGGTGLLADYQANDRTVVSDGFFPSAKVVGGYDFAGDAYNGGVAFPDPDPMDCNGHGTHVAGTAAGFGVNADGTTYAGPYTPGANYGALRVGPGTAPKALLYALRVFGCGGGTNLTVQAIDWAIDPNNDDDLSDHLDVINMSLGSQFGTVSNASAVAADNAALAGVIVVTSAGNNGDTYFISGSPGSGNRVLATAASADDGLPGPGIRINAPAGIAGFYVATTAVYGNPPPLGGITGNVVIGLDPSDGAGVLTTDGCSPLTNAAAVAGNIALIDRGTCGFVVKTKNAQDAGAIAVIIANTAAGAFNNLAGVDPTVTIPTVMATFADSNTFKANIPGLNATLLPAADTLGAFSSRGSRRTFLSGPRLKPDIAAPGVSITSAQTGVTCTAAAAGCLVAAASGFIANSQSLVLQGTSMASPHMAGIVALLRQLHPTWTVEEIKALAMNGAIHDVTVFPGGGARYGPGRVGAGRTDPAASAVSSVVAMNADDAGTVSVTFEDSEIVGNVTRTKHVRVVNHGAAAATFDLALDTLVDAPGVAFSLPGGNTVTIPAGDAVEIDVRMTADSTQMDHTRDATVAATQAAPAPLAGLGNLNRQWVTEEGAYITLSQGGNLKLRVPVYAMIRPASTMTAPATITTGGAGTGSTTIPLSGSDVCTGTLGAGPTCIGSFVTDEVSLVTPFELQVSSPIDPVNSTGYADLKYAGTAYDPVSNSVLFGLATWSPWSTLTDVSFNVCVDFDENGVYDRIVFNSNAGTMAGAIFGANPAPSAQDAFITSIFNTATNGVTVGTYVNRASSAVADTVQLMNDVLFLSATPAQLGLPAGDTTFRYKIITCPGGAPLCARSALATTNGCSPAAGTFYDQAAGPYFWSSAAQGLNFGGGQLFFDLNGATLPVTWNTANMTTNGSLGALLLHHHNTVGNHAEVVLLEGAPSADLSITKSMSPASPTLGQNVTFTVTVTNTGPDAATGVLVEDFLNTGLTYVSDDGGGAYDDGLGLWTVGALAASGSATLHVVATVDTSDPVQNTARIAGQSPLDPDPSDNSATVTVTAPRSADLALSMGVSSPTVLVGGSVIFTLTVTNNGDDPAYGLDVTEAFPALPSLNPTSFVASQGVYNPATGLWNLASLGSGNTATLALTFTAPNMAGALTNNGSAGAGEADPNTANNAASATVTVLSPATVSATKTVSGSFFEGGTVTYTLVLTNSTAYDQQNNPGPELTDVLPSQLTLVSASATAGTAVATVATNTVTWDGVVPANGSVTITIQATVNAGTATQTVSNQGNASFDADGNGVNEAAALTDSPAAGGAQDPTAFVVISPASVGIHTKTVTGTYVPGGTVVYTVTFSNPSASAQLDNPGDELTDVLPSTLTLVSATATSGSAVADVPTRTVHWNGSVPPGGSVTITITATLNSGTAGLTISNQGTIFFDADGNGTNEASILTDDPALAGASDPTSLTVVAAIEVPTLSELGLAILALLMASGALILMRRRRA
ncbi:MAG: IPTL-CTERM sorting domain-containing protein [Thermoanaerobaculia bacterium]